MREMEHPTSQDPTRGPRREAVGERSQALLRECYGQFIDRLHEAMHSIVRGTNDLFDESPNVAPREIAHFRAHRDEWLTLWERSQRSLYARRLAGVRRNWRRPDGRSSLATMQLLDPFDQDMQLVLIRAVTTLQTETGREQAALAPRAQHLLDETTRDAFDNPFDVQYVLDAIGATARSLYSTPHVWRTLMERVVSELTPVLVKIYTALNRYLADQNVLPDLKAYLRVRSPHQPADDVDLLDTFRRLIKGGREAGAPAPQVRVPNLCIVGQARRAPTPAGPAPARPVHLTGLPDQASPLPAPLVALPDAAVRAAMAALARAQVDEAPLPPDRKRFDRRPSLPSVDPLMALGTSGALVAALGRLQRIDLPRAILAAAPPVNGRRVETALVPSNLLPFLRAALAEHIGRESNALVMDFVALLFDYVFRDPTIPQPLHGIFERLQVPVVKTALIDASFFSDHRHPARQLLDSLAEAAIGADANGDYLRDFDTLAIGVVNGVCDMYRLETEVFINATTDVRRFIDDDHRRTALAISGDIAAAAAAEQRELGRALARAVVRERLAGTDVPLRVRAFAESVWVDYLVQLGDGGEPRTADYERAVSVLEGLLWSISTKERLFERQRLANMVPRLLAELRAGSLEVGVPPERIANFFEELFALHTAALAQPSADNVPGAQAATTTPSARAEPPGESGRAAVSSGIHDFVTEMSVGSWIAFSGEGGAAPSRLWWVSPMRTRYVFANRTRMRGWILTPEELVHDLENGKASVVAEPVPLFERAISAVFDAVGGKGLALPPAPA